MDNTKPDEPGVDVIRHVFSEYARLLGEGDAEGLSNLFSRDGYIEDPIGTLPHRGRDAIRAFFQAGFDQTGGRILFKPEGALRINGSWAAGAFIAICDRMNPAVKVETMDLAHFDGSGRLLSMTAVVGPTNFHRFDQDTIGDANVDL